MLTLATARPVALDRPRLCHWQVWNSGLASKRRTLTRIVIVSTFGRKYLFHLQLSPHITRYVS